MSGKRGKVLPGLGAGACRDQAGNVSKPQPSHAARTQKALSKRVRIGLNEAKSISRATSWTSYSFDDRRETHALRRSVSLSCLEGLPRRLCWRELAVLLSDSSAPQEWLQRTHSVPGWMNCPRRPSAWPAGAPASFLLNLLPHLGETLSRVLLDEVTHELGRVALLRQRWGRPNVPAGSVTGARISPMIDIIPSHPLEELSSERSSHNPRFLQAHRGIPERPLKRSNSMDSLHGCRRQASQSQSARQEALHRFRQLLTLQNVEPSGSPSSTVPQARKESAPTTMDDDRSVASLERASSETQNHLLHGAEEETNRAVGAPLHPRDAAALPSERGKYWTRSSPINANRNDSLDRWRTQTVLVSPEHSADRAAYTKAASETSRFETTWPQRWLYIWRRRALAPSTAARTVVRSSVYCLYESLCFWGHRDLGRTVKLAVEALLDELVPPGRLSCRRKILEYLIPCGCGSYMLWYLQRRRIIAGKPALYQMPRFHWTHLRTWRSAAFTVSYRMLRLAVIYRFFLKFGTPLYRLATLLALILSFFRAEVLSDLFKIHRWPLYLSFTQGIRTVIRSVVYAAAFSIPLERYGTVFAVSRRRANVRKAIFFGTVMLSGRVRSVFQQIRGAFRKSQIRGSRLFAYYGGSLH
ncbi:hypothetical protein CCYA_CCYA14G3762 [Cyanidiococcus yangmingshanensis]|nr:hypothetical protein CCYA_CCYA14G3762 [Cyanidiococcus yangmingshanensis]